MFTQQLVPNFGLGIAGSKLQSNAKSSNIEATNVAVFAQLISSLGRSLDVGASIAALSSSIKLCSLNPELCNSSNDTGSDLGVFGKVFLNEMHSASVALSYDAISYKNSPSQSIIGLSLVTILARHHKLAFSFDSVRDSGSNAISGGYGFGYSYIVYY